MDPKNDEDDESIGSHTDVMIEGATPRRGYIKEEADEEVAGEKEDIEMHKAGDGHRRGERAQGNEAHRRRVEAPGACRIEK